VGKYNNPPSRQKIFDSQDLVPYTNFSGFNVNGKSYHKLTGIDIHYKDVSLRKLKKLTPPPFRLVSDETVN